MCYKFEELISDLTSNALKGCVGNSLASEISVLSGYRNKNDLDGRA